MSVDDEAWLRAHLATLPRDVPPPERVAVRIEGRLAWRRRRRWLAPALAVAVAGWWVSWLVVEGPPGAERVAHRDAAPAVVADTAHALWSLDLELQAAYARGAADEELSALLAARVAMVSGGSVDAPKLRRL